MVQVEGTYTYIKGKEVVEQWTSMGIYVMICLANLDLAITLGNNIRIESQKEASSIYFLMG